MSWRKKIKTIFDSLTKTEKAGKSSTKKKPQRFCKRVKKNLNNKLNKHEARV